MNNSNAEDLRAAILKDDNYLSEYLEMVEVTDFRDAVNTLLSGDLKVGREKYHAMLDVAMNGCGEGESFLGDFANMVVKEAKE